MSDFGDTWRLVRGRFDDAVLGLSENQLNWRLHDESLTIGEMALHVAGVEVSFITQLVGITPVGNEARLKAAATDGAVNDLPFPFEAEEITPEKVAWALDLAREKVAALIDEQAPEVRAAQITSALGR